MLYNAKAGGIIKYHTCYSIIRLVQQNNYPMKEWHFEHMQKIGSNTRSLLLLNSSMGFVCYVCYKKWKYGCGLKMMFNRVFVEASYLDVITN